MRALHAAEGSDWFWWYGSDQDSGRDEVFDRAYRDLLAESYRAIGQSVPASVSVPIVLPPVPAGQGPTRVVSPTLDGHLDSGEWQGAAVFSPAGGAMATAARPLDTIRAGADDAGLHVAVERPAASQVLRVRVDRSTPGLPACEWGMGPDGSVSAPSGPVTGTVRAARSDEALEITVPWGAIQTVDGESLAVSVEVGNRRFPPSPLRVRVPVRPLPAQIHLMDATPDSVVALPTSGVYDRDVLDLRSLEVAADGDDWVFTWSVGSVRDPWHAPAGLSLVTLDAYVGLEPVGGPGESWPLLPGRRSRVEGPWTAAITVEGWESGFFRRDGLRVAEPRVTVDALAGRVRARVARSLLPGHPAGWRLLGTLSAQDGFSPGRVRPVRRVADVDHPGQGPFGGESTVLDAVETGGWFLRGESLAPPVSVR
jgi:hypothetical protein